VPGTIDTEGLRRRLLAGDVQLVEVLPEPEYAEEHLPGARHVPLAQMTARSVRDLDRAAPVVAYCFDYQ
jgi:rhodanese-related sulfurtransferase